MMNLKVEQRSEILAPTAVGSAVIRQVCEMLNIAPSMLFRISDAPYFITDHKIRFVLRETRFS